MKHLRCFAFLFCAVVCCAAAALADDDPPSRAVRLNYINGEVSVQPGGVDDWVPGTVNRPLTTSDRVWTDKNGRAELHLGTSAMRLSSETSLTLSNVTDNNVQLKLDQGTLNLRVVQLYQGEVYEVNTPNFTFTVLKPGSYRFDVEADTSVVTVRKGEGEATSAGPGVRLRSREQARFFDGNSGRNQISAAAGFDGFDDWCRVRDEREDRSVSVRYVPRGVVGYEDLDDYGHWVVAPTYGHIWVPASVVVGWAPYRYGHWIWVSPWGWTWVDDAPWGFAPFHYGRWVHYRGGWGWCPGPVVVRPYYAPALVAWVGGSHWGVGVSFGVGGGLGWFPLGYGEPYIPYYRGSRNYFRNVNVTNTRITNITYVTNNYYNNTNIRNIKYANYRINGAVSAISHDDMIHSRPVNTHMVHVSERNFKNVPVMARPDARPSRESRLGARAGEHGAAPPRERFGRPNERAEQDSRRDQPGVDRDRRDNDRREAMNPANTRAGEKADRRDENPHRPPETKQSVSRHVPRPPDRGATYGAKNDKDMASAEKPARHEVPRPPDRGTGVSNTEQRGRPATAAPDRSREARGPRESNEHRAVPRPPQNESQSARRTGEDSASRRATAEHGRPPSSGRPAEARIEPRPVSETRNPPRVAPAANRPDSGRPVARTAEVHRESRAPEVRRESAPPQRQAAPPAARQSGKSEARGKSDQRPQSKGDDRGKSQN